MSSATYVAACMGATLVSLVVVIAALVGGFALYARSDDFVQKLLSSALVVLGLAGALILFPMLWEMWGFVAKGAY